MKKELMFLLCFLVTTVCISQRKKVLYLSSELEIGNYLGAGIDLNYIYKDKYSLSIGAQGQLSVPTNFPKDYDASDDLPLTGFKSIGTIRVLLGRIFYVNSKQSIRLNLQVGLSSNVIEMPVNYMKEAPTPNGYRYTNYSDRSFGAMLSPNMEFTII